MHLILGIFWLVPIPIMLVVRFWEVDPLMTITAVCGALLSALWNFQQVPR